MCGSDTPFDVALGQALCDALDFDSRKRTIGKRTHEKQVQQDAKVESLAGTSRRAASFSSPDFFDSRGRFLPGIAFHKPLFQIFSRSRREA